MRTNRWLSRSVSSLVSAALLVQPLLSAPRAAAAETASSAPEAASAPDSSAQTTPTIVSEITERRTPEARHYRLSDGRTLARISAMPVSFKDAAGTWRDIDTNLVPDGPGRLTAVSAPMRLSVGGVSATEPVRVTGDGYEVTIDLLGAVEGVPLGNGSLATFPQVQPGTDLQYRQSADGVKETIVLTHPGAVSSWTFRMTHQGLDLKRTPLGSWALYRPGEPEPLMTLGEVSAWDSSANEHGTPDACPETSMQVTPTDAGALITVSVSGEWLRDPARVYPVMVDPTLSRSIDYDTFVYQGNPNGSYGSWTSLESGHESGGYCRAIFHFPVGSIPSIARVDSATFSAYAYYSTAVGNCYLVRPLELWDGNTTWYTRPVNQTLATQYLSSLGRKYFDVKATVADWIDGGLPNYGLGLSQAEDGSQSSVLRKYYSGEVADNSYKPWLEVVYTTIPDPIVYTTKYWSGLDWWRESDANRDGVPDKRNDFPRVGRGRVSIAWQPSARATGYQVLLFDGYAYRQVGCVPGDVTSWTSEACGAYPGDSEIAALPASSTGNPFRAVTLATGTPGASFSVGSAGTGVIASDGRYLYVRPWWSSTSGTRWRKVGTGLGGTTQGEDYGLIGPDFAGYPIRSALCLDGFVYNSSPVATSTTSTTIRGTWVGVSADAAPATFTFSGRPLIDMRTSASVLSTSNATLVTSDGSHIYCISDRSGVTPAYGGWNVRVFERDGTWSRDATISGPSFFTNGAFCDGEALYLIGNPTTLAKVRLSDFAHVNRWTTDGTTLGGCYDAVNNAFWVGQLDGSNVYRYRGPGFDLRDNPNPLYRKLGPTAYYDTSVNYSIMVVPYNDWGSPSCLAYTPTLGSRSVSVNDDPRHAEFAAGEAAGHDMSAVLDEGALSLSVTDLEIASWGPQAALARTYDSSTTASDRFAPGWQFSFESRVDTDGAYRDYTDESGEVHSFIVTAGAVYAPQGSYAQLTTDTAGTTITRKDGSRLSFDRSGRLVRETDRDGNAVTYAWGADTLTVIASNGQRIVVTFDAGGQAVSAVYATADGTRTVDYSTGTTATVTYFGGTADAHSVEYGYASSRLCALRVPELEAGGTSATWGFVYGTSGISEVRYPGYAADAYKRTAITYAPASRIATVTRTGAVSGVLSTVYQRYQWNPSGTTSRYCIPRVAAEPVLDWQYEYGPGHEAIIETSPVGEMVHRSIDASGNTIFSWDEAGHCTVYAYNQSSDCVREIDPRGCVTSRTIDASGHVLVERRRLNATEWARSERTYNASGAVTTEKRQLTATAWQRTDYSGFAPNGEACSTTEHDVLLRTGGVASDLVTTKQFDAFGNVLWEHDASGASVATYTYSPDTALRLVTSTDPSGTITHHAYDPLGRETSTSRTAGTEFCDWTKRVYDASGRMTAEATVLSGWAFGHTVTHNFDQMGRETISDDDKVTGQAKTYYDARGNAVQSWAEGSSLTSSGASTRVTYDKADREISRLDPGAVTASTVTAYNANGTVKRVDNADGTWATYDYDEGGNRTAEHTPADGGGTATATWEYDVGGRQVRATTADGAVTTSAYDLADRQTSAAADGESPSITVMNSAGWVISETEADGITTTRVYDPCGRVTSETRAGAVTASTYDSAGRLVRTVNPDGTVATYTVDAFGRTVHESHVTSTGAPVKAQATEYDTLSRVTSTLDERRDIERTYTYPTTAGSGTTVAVRVGSVTTTVSVDASGTETARMTSGREVSCSRETTVHDAAGREVAWAWNGKTGGAAFDEAGRPTAHTGVGWTGTGTTYTYGASGRLATETLRFAYGGRTEIDSYCYTLAGRLATATLGSVTTTYATDAFGRLVGWGVVGGEQRRSSYETGTGRILRLTDGAGALVRAYEHTATGARVSEGLSTATPSVRYEWAPGVRLAHYSDTSRSVTATYAYDAAGQRTQSVVTSGSLTTTTTYTYEGLSLLSLTATSTAGSVTETWSLDYLLDSASRPYAAIYAASDAAPMVVGMVTTARGDVAELVDETGAAFALYRTDAYGAPVEVSSGAAGSVPATLAAAIASRNPVRYAGCCFDEHSGLYYLSQRYYDPASRQFLSKDPARADGEESAYQYCGGDPVGRTDPSGCVTLSHVHVGEQGSNNCVSAAVRWVLWTVLDRGVPWEQLVPLTTRTFGRAWLYAGVPCWPATQYNVVHLRELYGVTSRYHSAFGSTMPFEAFLTAISAQRPLIMYCAAKPTPASAFSPHAVMVYGARGSGANRELLIWSWNWSAWVNYQELVTDKGCTRKMGSTNRTFRFRNLNVWYDFKRR